MNFLTVLWGAVMLAGLFFLLRIKNKAARDPRYKSLAGLLFLLILAGGFGLLHASGMLRQMGLDFGRDRRVVDADTAIYASQASVIGRYLKDKGLADGGILIIAAGENAELQAFKAALTETGIPAASLSIALLESGGGSQGGGSSTMQMTAQELDRLAQRNADSKVVISTVGIPFFDPQKLACIARRHNPGQQQWILTGALRDRDAVSQGLSAGNVLAAVFFAPDPAGEVTRLPEDPEMVFALRYLFCTRENPSGR